MRLVLQGPQSYILGRLDSLNAVLRERQVETLIQNELMFKTKVCIPFIKTNRNSSTDGITSEVYHCTRTVFHTLCVTDCYLL
jgi:hypothetical protein